MKQIIKIIDKIMGFLKMTINIRCISDKEAPEECICTINECSFSPSSVCVCVSARTRAWTQIVIIIFFISVCEKEKFMI